MPLLNEIREYLQQGNSLKVKELIQQALDEGIEARLILEEGLIKGMSIISEKLDRNEICTPHVIIASRAMNSGIGMLKQVFVKPGVKLNGTAVIGTVRGDLHDIGKNLVKMMIESKGITVIDLGVNVPAEKFAEAAAEYNANIVCCSALLTTTMPEIGNVIKALKDKGIRENVKVMIGGSPVTQEFCERIGADCYTPEASLAAEAAASFCT